MATKKVETKATSKDTAIVEVKKEVPAVKKETQKAVPAVKNEAAKKPVVKKEEVKEAVKTEIKAEVKAEVKPAAKTAAKAPAKKAPEKKAPVKKADPKATIIVEYSGKQVVTKDILDQAGKAFAKANKGVEVKTIEVYIKPEENVAYYVVNGVGSEEYKVEL